jgi:hypothetical protein
VKKEWKAFSDCVMLFRVTQYNGVLRCILKRHN